MDEPGDPYPEPAFLPGQAVTVAGESEPRVVRSVCRLDVLGAFAGWLYALDGPPWAASEGEISLPAAAGSCPG